VDEAKLQQWACENVGSRLNLLDAPLACWTCVHSAKLMAKGSVVCGQDWWTGLVDPNGSLSCSEDEDSEDEDESEVEEQAKLELMPCFVRLSRLSDAQIAVASSLKTHCFIKLTRISDEREKETDSKKKIKEKSFQCTMCRFVVFWYFFLV